MVFNFADISETSVLVGEIWHGHSQAIREQGRQKEASQVGAPHWRRRRGRKSLVHNEGTERIGGSDSGDSRVGSWGSLTQGKTGARSQNQSTMTYKGWGFIL